MVTTKIATDFSCWGSFQLKFAKLFMPQSLTLQQWKFFCNQTMKLVQSLVQTM